MTVNEQIQPIVYLNGAFLPVADAGVGLNDGGWLHGAGLFETMRAENGRIFRLESHMERLLHSTGKLLRPVGRHQLPSEEDFRTLLERNGLKAARVRMTVSAGPMQMTPTDDEGGLTVGVTAMKLASYPASLYDTGINVIVCRFRQSSSDPLAGHKTTCYLPRLLALRAAQQARCTEAIWFTTDNQLAEGSISNVFLVGKGVLKTPPLDTPVLPGVTRGLVLDIAGREGIKTEETALTIDDLLDADEAFLTNTMMQIMPVIRVERHTIGAGRAGPVARRLREEYRKLVKQECADE